MALWRFGILAVGHTIWIDQNAAGWGWLVDPPPRSDFEFTTPGNPLTLPSPQSGRGVVRNRMGPDLLTVLAHEIGHLLGQEHAQDGVMLDTVATGIRRLPSSTAVNDWTAVLTCSCPSP